MASYVGGLNNVSSCRDLIFRNYILEQEFVMFVLHFVDSCYVALFLKSIVVLVADFYLFSFMVHNCDLRWRVY
jgi:hypothetical protein